MRRRPDLAGELLGRGREFALIAAEHAPSPADPLGITVPVDVVALGIVHLEHLAVAMSAGRSVLFENHVVWMSSLRADREPDLGTLTWHLDTLAGIVAEHLPAAAEVVGDLVAKGLARVPDPDDGTVPYLDRTTPLGALAASFLDELLVGDHRAASRRVLRAADDGTAVEDLYLEVFQACLREVGRLWQIGRITVAQEHVVTAGTQLVMAQLYPRTFASRRVGRSVLVASVGGELHEVGARMVADIFELRGWDSHFAGANTPTASMAALVSDAADAVGAVAEAQRLLEARA